NRTRATDTGRGLELNTSNDEQSAIFSHFLAVRYSSFYGCSHLNTNSQADLNKLRKTS
ncbi:hypothetical protein L9F63_009984, partial [Diploptera punctata]